MEKTQKYGWTLPPTYLTLPTPESLSRLEPREVTAACHPIGNSYHEWRRLRNLTAGVLVAEAAAMILTSRSKASVADFLRVSQFEVAEKAGTSALVITGIALTASIFIIIRRNQYLKCVNDVGKEMDQRFEAANPKTPSIHRAFWATTPFQIMGAAQQLGRTLDGTAQSPIVAPIIGAAAFLGLAAGAVSQLRFGNTAPLQRLVEAL